MSLTAKSLFLFSFVFIACEAPRKPLGNENSKDASELVRFYECGRCHDLGDDKQEFELTKNCRVCHEKIKFEDAFPPFKKEDLDKWKKRIEHLYLVPSLKGVSSRLNREWFELYLLKPHKVRPKLGAYMPKLAIGKDQAKILADYFYDPKNTTEEQGSDAGEVEEGKKVFESRKCSTCHEGVLLDSISDAEKMAPDLKYTKQRMSRDQLFRWLGDPSSISPKTLMPNFMLSEKERKDLIAFIYSLPDIKYKCNVDVPLRLNMERKTSFKEIESKILKKTCWHCHSNPVPMMGDGGPGNTGGFGYKGKGVDFSSYESMMKGGLNIDGKPISLFKEDENGVPKIVAHLIARHYEVECGEYKNTLGMPLGLPPVEKEDINLLYNWVKQGSAR